jgi:hypothetical protein
MALVKMTHDARLDAFAPFRDTGCAQVHAHVVTIGQTAASVALTMMLQVGNKAAV